MNREIKFRAWDKNQKKIYTVVGLDFAEMNVIYGEYTDWEIHSLKNVILMQFTGLKDKNGKEIYEGDIVKFRDVRTNKDWVDGVVYWSGTEARFKADYWSFGNEIYTSTLEVIGTIYENPELLTQEQEARE